MWGHRYCQGLESSCQRLKFKVCVFRGLVDEWATLLELHLNIRNGWVRNVFFHFLFPNENRSWPLFSEGKKSVEKWTKSGQINSESCSIELKGEEGDRWNPPVCPKRPPILYILHYIWSQPYGSWSKVVPFIGNRVPFGTLALETAASAQCQCAPPSHDQVL